MTASGHKVASLTGAFDPAIRDNIIDEFRSGKAKVLIATNVLARGIDVQTVSLVVNYVSCRLNAKTSSCQSILNNSLGPPINGQRPA